MSRGGGTATIEPPHLHTCTVYTIQSHLGCKIFKVQSYQFSKTVQHRTEKKFVSTFSKMLKADKKKLNKRFLKKAAIPHMSFGADFVTIS